MGSAAYKIGQRFEYRVRDHLIELGYWVVRTPASKSPVDLVALAPNTTLLVQCKVDGRLDPAPWNALWNLANQVDGKAIVVFREGRKLCWRHIIAPKLKKRGPTPWLIIPKMSCVTSQNGWQKLVDTGVPPALAALRKEKRKRTSAVASPATLME